MVRTSAVAMMAVAFALGVLFGLMLHMDLPGVSSPMHDALHQKLVLSRHERSVGAHEHYPRDQTVDEWGAMIDLGEDEPRQPYDEEDHPQQVQDHKLPALPATPTAEHRRPTVNSQGAGGVLDSVREEPPTSHRTEDHGATNDSSTVKQNTSTEDTNVNTPSSENAEQIASLGGVIHGITWTKEMEELSPHAFTDTEVSDWRDEVMKARMVGVEEGCGRMQNRLVVLETGTRACARYRVNTDQIQGELYSFYLSRLLGMEQVPPPVVVRPDPQDNQWSTVEREVAKAGWVSDRPVLLTPWISNLVPTHIPRELREDTRALTPALSHQLVINRTTEELGQLVQWSDLLVFDYLTANLDRVVNNMFNQQWNPSMMDNAAHNLERDPGTGRLLFLDNESGLFHSYRLLEKYHHYHDKLLSALCVFRGDMVKAIKDLHQAQDAGTRLMNLVRQSETLADLVPRLPDKNAAILQQRIADVYQQITRCERIYTS